MGIKAGILLSVLLLSSPGARAEEHYWYDGDRRELVTLNPGMTMDFTEHASGRSQLTVPKRKTSPVFHDGRQITGRKRSLPGGIIVQFNPDWTSEKIAAWCSEQNLPIAQRLQIDGNWYVLKTEAGLTSLETANRVHESGEVLSATPNWWIEMHKR